ncbi:MAG: MATE family efflux transporter [Pseudomonadota bacterium]
MDAEQSPRPFNVTNAMVFNIAWPMTLAFLTTPLLGIVDTAVVGQLGDAALMGGLAVGAILFDIIFTTFNFLRAGTTGLVAQAFGKGSRLEEQAVLLRSALVSIAGGLLVILLAGPMLEFGLYAMSPTQAVADATRTYFTIRILAAPLTLANYTVLGWLLGLGQAGRGLAVQTVLNGVNIALSVYFGLILGWGIEGVAWATVCGEAAGLAMGAAFLWAGLDRKQVPDRPTLFQKKEWVRLFAVNRDILIRSFCLVFAFAFFTAQGAQFGEATLAANAVLFNFFIVAGYFLDGFATAAEQLAGRAVGAQYRPAFDRAVKLTLFWGSVLAILCSVVSFLFGPLLIDAMTTNTEVREIARLYLPWAAFAAIAGVVAFQMDGVFIGATWSRDMRDMMLISLVAYLAVFYALVPVFENHALWFAIEIFLGLRGITLFYRMNIRLRETFG